MKTMHLLLCETMPHDRPEPGKAPSDEMTLTLFFEDDSQPLDAPEHIERVTKLVEAHLSKGLPITVWATFT